MALHCIFDPPILRSANTSFFSSNYKWKINEMIGEKLEKDANSLQSVTMDFAKYPKESISPPCQRTNPEKQRKWNASSWSRSLTANKAKPCWTKFPIFTEDCARLQKCASLIFLLILCKPTTSPRPTPTPTPTTPSTPPTPTLSPPTPLQKNKAFAAKISFFDVGKLRCGKFARAYIVCVIVWLFHPQLSN